MQYNIQFDTNDTTSFRIGAAPLLFSQIISWNWWYNYVSPWKQTVPSTSSLFLAEKMSSNIAVSGIAILLVHM